MLTDLSPEQRPVAEQLLRGGLPAVRTAIAEQNAQARASGQPEVPADQLVAMAERLHPRLRDAEWLDRAEAARDIIGEVDLRDLRSVVVAGERSARNDESRALLKALQDGLERRVLEDQHQWVSDLAANIGAGRFVRALRLSSRPPKAGTAVPKEVADRLAAAVSEGLTERTNQELWAAALDALAVSPIRAQVRIASRPAEPTDELLEAVRRVADQLPEVALLFGVDPSEAAAARRRRPRHQRGARASAPAAGGARPTGGGSGGPGRARPIPPPPVLPAPAGAAPADDATSDDPTSDAAPSDAAPGVDPAPPEDAGSAETEPSE